MSEGHSTGRAEGAPPADENPHGVPSTAQLLDAAVTAINGRPREGQSRMAEAVTRACETGRHLAVQAGTGTGKSLAYLVPAIRQAQLARAAASGAEDESDGASGGGRGTVIVSTATIALQSQLVNRDLPRLADALEPELPARPTFAILKGRSNYLCLNKLNAPEPVGATEELIDAAELTRSEAQAARVREWSETTTTGDRADLERGVSDMVWRAFSVTSKECLGAAKCPHGEQCFAQLARRKAAEVDVVVTNHAMLAIDAMSDVDILPEHEIVIADEAHELVDRVTSAATATLSARMLTLAAGRAEKLGGGIDTEDLKQGIEDLRTVLDTADEGRWTQIAPHVDNGLCGVKAALTKLAVEVDRDRPGKSSSDPEKSAERENLHNHLGELVDTIDRILAVSGEDVTAGRGCRGTPADDEDVVWLNAQGSGEPTINVAPLSVTHVLAGGLFAQNTVILTSATLTLGGAFDAMAASWGMAKGTWDGLDVGAPFDAGGSILYVPRFLPDPGRNWPSPEALDEMEALISAIGGRTLGLFTSRRAAETAAEAMRERLGVEILLQGEDSIGALQERFTAAQSTCLFGSLSFWQGVDIAGPSLSLVIIDRLPFPHRNDPLALARQEAADRAGRNGFMEVSASHAALLLAQGSGRLLRSDTDRGMVAVLDRRLATKRYGKFLIDSMQRFWSTSDPSQAHAALKRLRAQIEGKGA